MAKNYVKRGDWFHYLRRVPKHLAAYDQRAHVRIALKTQSEKEAIRLSAIYDEHIEKYWRELIRSGKPDNNLEQFKSAKSLAMAHGFIYRDLAEIVNAPLPEALSRIEAASDNPQVKAPALLGTIKRSGLRLSACPEELWPLCADRWVGRSKLQIRKYKTPRETAMKEFVDVVGDKYLGAIERSDILKFRSSLMELVADDVITGNTANKKLGHLKDILKTVGKHEEVETDFKLLFAETRLAEDVDSRPPFDVDFVQRRFLDSDALQDLNDQAKALVYMMVETGARESELIGLMPEDYILNHEIPHIWIRKNRLRTLKTKTSDRKIPLIGVALIAAREVSETGITRYKKNPYSASGTINKYLKKNGLKPTPKHSLYSLRHTFKDRLRDVGAPEEVIDELMGHKKSGPKYGRGHLLESKLEWLSKVSFDVPSHIKEKRSPSNQEALS